MDCLFTQNIFFSLFFERCVMYYSRMIFKDVESNDLKEYEIWIMGEADANGDGELSKDELKKLFFG